MSEDLRRSAAHVQALARLQPGWDHEIRGHFGAGKIQLDLMIDLIARQTGDSVRVDQLLPVLERAQNAVRKFEAAMQLQSVERYGPQRGGDLLDLALYVASLGPLLGPTARDRKVGWATEAPSGPLWIDGGEPALREALTIAAVEMLFLVEKQEDQQRDSVLMRLETNGERASLRIESPRMPPADAPWLVVVRETLAKFGGEVRTSAALELDLVVPRAAVSR